MSVLTVLDLKRSSPVFMRNSYSVNMEKIVRELNGVSSIDLEEVAPPKKVIVCSRSVGFKVTDLTSLEEAVTLYTSRAAEKLSRQQSYASTVHVFINTCRFNDPKDSVDGSSTMVTDPLSS